VRFDVSRQLKRLTVRTVATLKEIGRHADGGNLYCTVAKSGEGVTRRWTFMYEYHGRQREAGFGNAAVVSLAQARERAAEYRSLLSRGIDPLDAKKASQEAAATRKTFGECANELIKSKRREWRSEVHARQWRTTIDNYCHPILDMPVDAVDTVQVLRCLQPVWNRAPETGSRLRGRIEAVLDYGKAHGWRDGQNPAMWRGHLSHLLAKRSKLSRLHHAAMPYADVPKFLATIRDHGVAGAALEFTVLSATRANEVINARWHEIDFETRVWSIPPARTKQGTVHRVPLVLQTRGLLESMAAVRRDDFIFPGLSTHSMLKLCPPALTVHGFRSSFRDWCADQTTFPREICEMALGHAVGGAVEQAYYRTDLLERRRELMSMWASFCTRPRA
jgi:integrase